MRLFGADTNAQKIERLKSLPIFHELTRKEILEMDELLHERVFENGEVVFAEGDLGHGIFIIVSGKLRISSCHEILKAANVDIGAGEMIGELCLFDEAPHAATVKAVERTVVVALFQAELSALLVKNKSIGVKVLFEIARTLSRRTRQLLLFEKHVPSV